MLISGRTLGVVFALCVGGLALENASLLAMPPVWDALAGTFAPAIHLYETGFDLPALLAAPGYLEGGPNTHSLGLLTFVTLAALWSTGGEPALYLPLLHGIQIGLGALAATATFALARRLLGIATAVAVTASLLLIPVFRVQTGALHTEVAGAATTVLAVASFATGRRGWTITWVLLACWIKSFGLILVAALGLLIVLDTGTSRSDRLRQVGAMAGPALAFEVVRWLAASGGPPMVGTFGAHLADVWRRLLWVPDVLGLVVLSLASGALWLRSRVRSDHDEVDRRAIHAILLVPIAMLAFVVTAPLSGAELIPLPRYYCWILPLLLLATALAVRDLAGRRAAAVVLTILALFSLANRDGRFYPDAGTRLRLFSQAERSLEYLDFYRVQREAVRSVPESAGGRPTLVTRAEFYALSSPLMGWVDEPVGNATFVLSPPYDSADVAELPDDFCVLDAGSNRYHGQARLGDILTSAARSGYRVTPIRHFQHGAWRGRLVRVVGPGARDGGR